MGASDSFLASPDYGYDYVVAVTQDSICSTALAFLHARQPVVNVCYVYDDDSNPVQIDYQALLTKTKGADPFAMPAATDPGYQAEVENLYNAGFMFGFSAALGLPEGFPVAQLPPIVTLGATAADPVAYRLLCRTFVLVEIRKAPGRDAIFTSYAQPKGPSGEPWVFTYQVNLVDRAVADNGAFVRTPGFDNLPAQIQAKLTAKPNDFTIRQLLYDFTRAACTARPQISGVKNAKLLELLYEDFSATYFAALAGADAAIVAVTPKASDPFAGLHTSFSVNALPSSPAVATLNYLCTTAEHPLPPPRPFGWTWVNPPESDSFDGVCAMNRNLFVAALKSHLDPYVESNKWLPNPIFIEVYFTTYDARFGIVDRHYTWPEGKRPPIEVTVEKVDAPPTGALLLHYQFGAQQEYDYLSGTSWMLGRTSFDLTVTGAGNTVTVTQHALVSCKLVMVTFDRHEWNLVDLTLTDTFTLAVDHQGDLVAHRTSTTVDHSASIGGDFAVPDLKQRFEQAQTAAKGRVQSALIDLPLSLVDDVIFPGGKGFLFSDVRFSDHQDLVAHLTYADPS